jgi:hypothetical protein
LLAGKIAQLFLHFLSSGSAASSNAALFAWNDDQ